MITPFSNYVAQEPVILDRIARRCVFVSLAQGHRSLWDDMMGLSSDGITDGRRNTDFFGRANRAVSEVLRSRTLSVDFLFLAGAERRNNRRAVSNHDRSVISIGDCRLSVDRTMDLGVYR